MLELNGTQNAAGAADLIVDGTPCEPHTYACRPPHTPHGPFKSETGCILFELHYY